MMLDGNLSDLSGLVRHRGSDSVDGTRPAAGLTTHVWLSEINGTLLPTNWERT